MWVLDPLHAAGAVVFLGNVSENPVWVRDTQRVLAQVSPLLFAEKVGEVGLIMPVLSQKSSVFLTVWPFAMNSANRGAVNGGRKHELNK